MEEKHYGRNQYNIELPKNKQDVDDGKREVIFDPDWNVVTADEDMGTYNYADPDLGLAHFIADVLPWIIYGNTPEDTTKWYERIGGFLGLEN